jgi:hypothetical protein
MKPIYKLILPDNNEILLYSGLGLGLLVFNNIQKYWAYFSSDTSFDNVVQYNNIALMLQQFLINIELKIDPRLADFTAWMIIGFISIIVVMGAQKVLGDSERDIEQANKLGKTRFGRIVKTETTYRIALRLAGIVLTLIWFRLFFGAIFNALSNLFFEASVNILGLQAILILYTTLLTGLGLYIFAICFRLVTLKIRVFSQNT